MGQQFAIVVGLEEAADFDTCPHAVEEAMAFAKVLEKLGIPKTNLTLLTGPTATKTALESRLRKYATNRVADDELWLVVAAPAFTSVGKSYLACADTLEDDHEATSVALSDAFNMLNTSGAQVRVLLDAAVDTEELHDLFADSGHVCLFAGVPSHVGGGRRLWLKIIGDALSGAAPDAIRDGAVTAGSLHTWLQAELPRAVRKGVSAPKQQQPELYGSSEAHLANVTAKAPKATAKLDLKQLKRVVFRGEASAPVKSLRGFQKGFRLPENASPSAQKMINRIATEDLKADIEDRYNEIREHLGIKRKDLESSIGTDGVAFIRSPAFDYIISVAINPDDPATLLWRREVCQISDPDVLRSDGFRTVFGSYLDSLQFDFDKPIDVPELVDRIEDNPPPGVKVRVAADGSRCDVIVQGFAGSIHVERATLRIVGRPGSSPDSLVEQFFAFQTQFGTKKGLPALKDKGKKN